MTVTAANLLIAHREPQIAFIIIILTIGWLSPYNIIIILSWLAIARSHTLVLGEIPMSVEYYFRKFITVRLLIRADPQS